MKPLLILAFIATPALATPSFSVSAPQCTLGYHCAVKITKTGYASSYSDISVSTSGAVAQPVTPTVRFQRGDTVKTVYAQSLSAGSFMATIKRVRYAVIGQGMAIGVVVGPVSAPTPVPAPTPDPLPSGPLPSPSLDGLPPIASPFNINDALQPAWGNGAIPASAAPDVVGAFRFICRDSGTNNDDPIVYPGQPGKSHGHQYYCHGADAATTYESLRLSAGPFNGAGKCVNCSAYWMPQMLDANGQVVKPQFVSIYYKRRPASDPKCGGLGTVFGAEGKCIAIPNGLRFVFGYDMLTGKPSTGQTYFNCQGPGAVPGAYPNITVALANCPAGALLGAIINAPDCWSGKGLDSANHRDHVAFEARDVNSGQESCPATHPYVIPKFTLGAWFPVAAGMHLSSDVAMNAVPGTTFHADYFEAWDPIVKAMWTDNCINKMLNCSGGDLGNGFQIRGAQ